MKNIDFYRSSFLEYIAKQKLIKEPKNLYEPINYIMQLGGKRLRPILTLMACDLFEGKSLEALSAAMAIELFHNFSLIHDDIMDDAPLRRGKKSVHEKWDINTGILSGDAMLVYSYKVLDYYSGEIGYKLYTLFTKTALEVCEGQQYDIDFETRNDVAISEYLKMIEYKTAVLVAAALKMGAIIAGATERNQDLIYEFGRNLGLAFQLQDDYLDAFGDPKTFGKQVGGDIIENKKTYLFIKAIKLGNTNDKKTLQNLFVSQTNEPNKKINTVKAIFNQSGAVTETKNAIDTYTKLAFESLDKIEANEKEKNIFKTFGEQLMIREN